MLGSGSFWSGVGVFVLLAAAALAALAWYMFALPGRGHRGPLPVPTAEERGLATRLKRHVVAIASTPHNVYHCEALEAAARYIEGHLAEAGYTPAAQEFETDGCLVRNIEATIPAAGGSPRGTTLVVGAHYDSAGFAPGANDNGTGTAAVLELARLLKDLRPSETTLRLVLFVNEEPPYFRTENMGSLRYARMLKKRGERVTGMMSLETLGYFSDVPHSQHYPLPLRGLYPTTANFIAFVGMPGSRTLLHEVLGSFRAQTAFPTIGGIAPDQISGIGLSDHWAFVQNDFPAIMITDTAFFRYPHYHRPTDTPDKIDYERLARITKGIERVVRQIVR